MASLDSVFTVCTYNILDQGYLDQSPNNTPVLAGQSWANRLTQIDSNIKTVSPKILMVQECSKQAFQDLERTLSKMKGYHVLHNGRQEGVAIFFSLRKFDLKDIRTLNLSTGKKSLYLDLVDKKTGKIVRAGTMHPTGGPYPKRSEGDLETTETLKDLEQTNPNSVVQSQYKPDYIILGADLNQDENPSPTSRLNEFTKRHYSADGITNETEVGKKRQIDHIFGKSLNNNSPMKLSLVDTSVLSGGSDHRPKATQFKIGNDHAF